MLSLSFNLQAQGWLKYYNDNATQDLSSMLVTPDDGFLLVGSQEDDEKILLIKTDAEGEEEWTKFYDLPGVYYSRVFEKSNGHFVIYAKSTPATTQIIEINTADDVIQDYNLSYYCNQIIEATDGNYIAINESFNTTNDIEVFKFDTNGNEIWSVILDETKDENPFDIIAVSDGGFMITGERREVGTSVGEGMLMKIDENGVKELVSYVSNMNIVRKIIQTQDGNFVYTGYNITIDADLQYKKLTHRVT
ncbi:MAG: hypothetical protein ACI9XO_004504 [Paraglaciecola sp.]|jgi:hypothetical protein